MRLSVSLALLTAFSFAPTALSARNSAPLQQPDLGSVLQKAAAYLDDYQTKLATVIAEEAYQQSGPFGMGQQARLRSDLLLVQAGGSWVEFRDVYESGGRPVRDHQARLEAILSGPDVIGKAQKIADESARYNGTLIPRNINVPTMALTYLMRANQARSSFKIVGDGDQKTVIVGFQETARPALIHSPVGVVATSGRFWINPESGAVTKTELTVSQEGDVKKEDAMASGTITVTYAADPKLKFRVPHEMSEDYSRPARVQGHAIYSNYKSFDVVVNTKTGRGGR